MALRIINSNVPYSSQTVALSGFVYTLVFKYNKRNDNWYLDILDASGQEEIFMGIKIMPNQNLTGRYRIPELIGGNLWCLESKASSSQVSYNNLGVNAPYQVYWVTEAEEREIGVDGKINL